MRLILRQWLLALALIATVPTPAAPIAMFVVNHSGSGGGAGGPAGVPDFETEYSLEWTPVLPEEPVTTSSATVSSAAEFNTAQATPGTHITMQAGSYGNLSVTGDDLLITQQDGATVGNLEFGGGANRVKWVGESCRDPDSVILTLTIGGGNEFTSAADNIRVTCVYVNDSADGTNYHTVWLHGHYVLLDSSEIRTTQYGFYSDEGPSLGRPYHVYAWNNRVNSGNITGGASPQHSTRFTGCDDCALLDNNFDRGYGGQMLRVYARGNFRSGFNQWQDPIGCSDCFGSSVDGSTSGDSGTPTSGMSSVGIRVVGDTFYSTSNPFNTSAFQDSTGTTVYIGENVTYGGTLPTTGPAGYTFGTATNNSYTTPPAWVHYEDR